VVLTSDRKNKLKNYTDLFNGEGGGRGAWCAQDTIFLKADPGHQHGPYTDMSVTFNHS